jgi:hypothetical protein
MVDVAISTALFITLFACSNNQPVHTEETEESSIIIVHKCPNGSPAIQQDVYIISKPPGEKDILVEFDINSTPKFVLYADGSLTKAGDFEADEAALLFWKAIALTYNKVCPSVNETLHSVFPK